ncbi:MAG TPA: flagellar biosynthesis protein FlhF [Methylomusa anaerophila]|uniref:flagellar biosynthesis protein FlhF n=1 Tax=Methylomusa anaerophila TaxID=1930071 RepID=UPI001E568AED|nr:flagellar biosynthesis protein FlhF [Methylomusa anaerophila]HML87001.1 flagellar biosynthesis protein FlhF [Methylomusa anaerophila]
MKLFTAQTMNEAMAQVKHDLGRDAVILHTRRLRKGGFFGFFAKDMVEVMAALETAPKMQAAEKGMAPANTSVDIPSQNEARLSAIQFEMGHMRKMVERMLYQLPVGDTASSPLMELLVKNDVEPLIAADLINGIPNEKNSLVSNKNNGRKLLIERIMSYLQNIDGITIPPAGKKIVAFIGPTGVGKTTTIAKLAANFAIKEGYKVALVTADTYRIAAVEQLKTYADIIGIPLEIVYTPDDLKAALYRHGDKQLVLIDTAGRSPGNSQQLEELKELLAVDSCIETHLVLSANTKYKDAVEIVNKFSLCSPQKFLFTKIDESSNLGTILNLLYHFPTALSYITTGQNVPTDIELVDSNCLANMILRDL